MAKDVIARLKADTSQWDSGLSRAGRSLNQFKQQNLSMEGVLNQQVKTLLKVGAQYASYGAAISGAMKVAKDAFMNTEQGIDTWGRAMQASEGVYNTFLQTLNNGNWKNFFDNLNDAINGSVELYNALDRLGSIKANNSSAIAIEQKALADARLKLQEAKAAGDKAALASIQSEIQAHEARLVSLRNQEVNAGKKAGYTDIKETLRTAVNTQQGGPMDSSTLDRVTKDLINNGQAAFDKYAKNVKTLEKKAMDTRVKTITDEYGKVISTYEEQFVNISKLTKTEQAQLRMARAVTSAETQLQRGIGTYATAVSQSAHASNEQFRYNRQAGLYGNNKNGGSSSQTFKSDISGLSDLSGLALGATKSMKQLNDELARYKKMREEATTSFEYNAAVEGIEQVQKEIAVQPIALQLGVDTGQIVPIQESINNFFKEHPIELLPTDYFKNFDVKSGIVKSADEVADSWAGASKAIGAASSALSQIEDPGAKVAGIIASALATLAQTYAMSLKGTAGPWDWIAASISGAATLASISGVVKQSAEYHADGGMVGMSPFIPKGTDTVPAMLTPGEIVLNAAQQRNMAENLQGSTLVTGGTFKMELIGDQLIGVINNTLTEQGKQKIG